MARRPYVRGPRRATVRQYAAAKAGRLVHGWMPAEATVNDEIRTSSAAVRSRIRQLVRDFGPLSRAVDILETLVVGPDGYSWQSKHERRVELEAAVRRWSEQADASGQLHFCELQALAERQICECGEYLFLKIRDRKAWAPFQLLALEPDRLTSPTLTGSTLIDQGVEYEALTGRPVAYHIDHGEYRRDIRRVLAADIMHGYHWLRPGQLRGISPFASGVLLAGDLAQYVDAEIDGAKMAAKYLAMVETPDTAGFQAMRGVGSEAGPDGQQQRIEELENAVIEYLNPGEKITLAANPRPGSGFEPFVRFTLRMLSITTGVPYDILSGDYSQSNYSSSRLARNDFGSLIKSRQRRRVRHLCQPALAEAMDAMVMSDRIVLPGYWRDPWLWLDGRWTVPGLQPIDPLKESKAQRDQIDATLCSEIETAAERGRDYEEVLDEIARAKAMREARGLTVEQASTATASNPATIMDEEDA